MLTRFVVDENGATAIEYGMLCSLGILTILAALSQVADNTVGMWTQVASHV